jgi:putative transposase
VEGICQVSKRVPSTCQVQDASQTFPFRGLLLVYLSGLRYNCPKLFGKSKGGSMNTVIPLIPGTYFHIFNRGNNREKLFREVRNYECFLRLYAFHIAPIADTYAYCLLKNHFHFLVRIKDGPEKTLYPAGLSKPFSNFFNAFTRTVNKEYGRTGALFQRPFGRIAVTSDSHLLRLIVYIHQNPQKHRLAHDFREWPFSSFHVQFSVQPSFVNRENVMKLFGNRQNWHSGHRNLLAGRDLECLGMECFE